MSDQPGTPQANAAQSGESKHLTCYAQTHRRGPGYMAVCQQVSNIVATDDPDAVTCDACSLFRSTETPVMRANRLSREAAAGAYFGSRGGSDV